MRIGPRKCTIRDSFRCAGPAVNQQSADNIAARLSTVERLLATDPKAADREVGRLLDDVPGHPMALLFRGIARRLTGDIDSAIAILGSLSESNPDAPFPYLQLGLAEREAGDAEGALASMRKAVSINPDFADAWLALAGLLVDMGRAEDADRAFASYIPLASRDPQLREAGQALAENRLTDADALLRRLLGRNPHDVVALCMLADVLEKNGQTAHAETILAQCLELAPGYGRPRHNFAVVYLRQNRPEEALEQSDRALVADPGNRDFRKLRAAILLRLMRFDESIEVCEELLDEDAAQPTVWTSLGHLLKTVGRHDDAIAAYRRAIALEPRYGEPYWSLANMKTASVSDDELARMRAQLEKPEVEQTDRLHFHFAIGRALEDRECYAQSFEHYTKGNGLRLEQHPWDPDTMSVFVEQCRAFFTPDFFAKLGDAGSGADDPIFVLGLPRSGSTLVEQILASHSAVEGTSELNDMPAIVASLGRREVNGHIFGYPDVLGELDTEAFRELGEAYLASTRVHRIVGTPYFIDKKPNNFAHIGLIHAILPHARIIDIRRHPLACGLSLFKEHFARSQEFSYSLEYIGRYYRDYMDLMAHFEAVLPGRVCHIIYESLVANTETEVRRMLDYCGLHFEEACLAFHETRRAVSTASSEQVRKPIYTEGLEHWKHYALWLEELERELGEFVETYRTTAVSA